MALTIDQVWRDFNSPSVPSSGDHEPVKSEIRALLKQIQNSGGQSVTRNTLAALNAVTPPNENYMGIVLSGSGSGYYSRSGSAWVFGRGFPDTLARVTLTGSGSAQIGNVSVGVYPSSIEVFYANVITPNTGPMTLTIDAVTRPVVNIAGNPLSAGEWTGMVMFWLNDADQYQLLIDAGASVAAAMSASEASDSADRAGDFAAMLSADKVNFKTILLLLSDTMLSYTAGPGKILVAPGDVVQAGGYRYSVAASGASDNNVVTSGAVKLYVLPDTEGRVSPIQWGASTAASAATNQAAFVACASFIVANGFAQIVPGGTYEFNNDLFYPQNTTTYWDNVIMLKQYDGEGIRFGSGPTAAFIHGKLMVQKGSGGSGPTPNDGNFATGPGTVVGDHGVVFAGRIIQTGEVSAMFTHDIGVVLEATANGNHSQFNLIRGLRIGNNGVAGRGTRDDNAVWDINIFSYGCWDSGIYLPDTYHARAWTGILHSEANCRKATGDDFYAGFMTVSEIMLYVENVQAGVNEIRFTANSARVNYFDVRANKTINDATRKETILAKGQYLVGNNPVASFVRAAQVIAAQPSRYVSEIVESTGNLRLRDWRTYGTKMSLALDVSGALVECFDFRGDGNLAVNRSGKGIRLVAPNGSTIRFLTIDNAGAIALLTSAP